MSKYAMLNALMTPGLTPNESRVYAYLVGRANGSKVCWPTVEDIAADLGMCRRAVIDATTTLQGDETDPAKLMLVKVTRRYRQSNSYTIIDVPGLHDAPRYSTKRKAEGPLPWSENDTDEEVQNPAHHPIVQNYAHSTVQNPAHRPETAVVDVQIPAPPMVQICAPESVQQESNKKEKKETLTLTPESVAPSARASAHATDEPGAKVVPFPLERVDDARAVWNEVCAPVGFPACREMPDARRANLKRLLATRFVEPGSWRQFCELVASSAFLAGGNFGIDWVIKPANLTKIVEGNYNNRSRPSRTLDPSKLTGFAAMAYKRDLERAKASQMMELGHG